MAEGKSESKIHYEKIAEMGSGLIIAKVPAECIREQDVNARVMKNEMQKQLTDNIKKRGQLESLPFCALTCNGTKIEIISGHHRIQSGKDAGIKEFFVILDISGLNRSNIVAKQIAHNAIAGFDDKSTLKELAKMLEDVDDMIESYAGKEFLQEPDAELDKFLSPTVEFDWKNIVFTFLPHQVKDLNKLIDTLQSVKPDFIGYSDVGEYKEFIEAIAKFQNMANVKNTGAAIHAMIKSTEDLVGDVGFTDDKEWVQLTAIFGGSAIPAESAETIKEALAKVMSDCEIGNKEKWKAIELWATDYLGRG
ncbi:ParB N-terminal domain-containing protein [Anaerovibrio sp. RM50]|uniref:ParB N-terminal domain-containing protein n=1 Tax=Anaerovibrio sp. RM50 TaxID=1200557 RepID=UPI0004884577|nr:ParB N-terminal domain-containing protein [Anaerovibrio sp. RM50]